MAESPSSAAAAAGPSSSQQASQEPTFSQQRAATRDTNFGPTATQPDQQQRQEAPDIVRPGRLLTTLHAMRQELEVQLVSAGGQGGNHSMCVTAAQEGGGQGWQTRQGLRAEG